MLLTEQFYVNLGKHARDRLEEIIDEETKHNLVGIHPLKVSLINISIFCTNAIIDADFPSLKTKAAKLANKELHTKLKLQG